MPIEENGDGERFVANVRDQKPLAIGADRVGVAEMRTFPATDTGVDQNSRRGDDEPRRGAVDIDGNQLFVRRDVKELFAVGAPLRLVSAPLRDLPPRAGCRKRLDVHFVVAVLTRGVGDPAAVR